MDARCSRPGLPAEGEEPQASVVIYRSRSAPVTHSGSEASFSGSRPPDGGRPGASSAAPPLLGVQGGSPGTRPRGSGAPAGCPPLPAGVPSRTLLGTRTVTGRSATTSDVASRPKRSILELLPRAGFLTWKRVCVRS